MRILYLQPAEGFGGAERQGVLAIKYLPEEGVEVVPVVGPGEPIRRALEEAGIRDYVFCSELPTEMEGLGSLPVRLRRAAALLDSWSKTCLMVHRVAVVQQVDLFFASRTFGWFVAAAVGQRLDIPVVWRAGSRAAGRIQRAALFFAGRSGGPDALVCNCEAVHESIAPLLGCRSFVVPNGVDLTRFNPRRARPLFRNELGLGAVPVVGVPARPAPEKGFDLLADVVERFGSHVPDLHVLIAGEFPWKRRYETLFSERGLDEVVTFLGHVDDMESFYQSCDVVLLTSRQRSIEGSSNALLEAMAMKRPVVATRVGGIGEAINHEVEGFLSDPDDADQLARYVMTLLHDPALSDRMGAAGRTRISKEFSERTATARLAEVLRVIAEQT